MVAEIAAARRRIAVVPGGGPFADAVRAAHRELKFSEAAAHSMAMLAMEQMAHLLCDMQPKLRPVSAREEFDAAWEARAVPVWCPSQMAGADSDLPRTWSMTSDSLAAWLARVLR